MGDPCADFYSRHRGGSGAVVVVTAVNLEDSGDTRVGIFGSVETADVWRRSLPENYTCVYAPYIVDDPEWGNEAPQ